MLVPEEQLAVLLQRLQTDDSMRDSVKGVLVVAGTPTWLSPAEQFPLAAYAPYRETGYQWNQNGTGISMLDIGRTPVFLLEGHLAVEAQQHAEANAAKVRLCSTPYKSDTADFAWS